MGLSINNSNGYPVFTCDRCGEEIEELVQGVFTFDDSNIIDGLIPIHMYHNGDCDQRERFTINIAELFSYLLNESSLSIPTELKKVKREELEIG